MDIVEKLRKMEQVCRAPINTEAGEAADEITRLRAENERLTRERDEALEQKAYWRDHYVAAERKEGELTKERDESNYTAHVAETCCARAEERAEAAERKLARLREAAKRLTNSNHSDDSAIEDLEAAIKETGPEGEQ